jgi:hypothetical protein
VVEIHQNRSGYITRREDLEKAAAWLLEFWTGHDWTHSDAARLTGAHKKPGWEPQRCLSAKYRPENYFLIDEAGAEWQVERNGDVIPRPQAQTGARPGTDGAEREGSGSDAKPAAGDVDQGDTHRKDKGNHGRG